MAKEIVTGLFRERLTSEMAAQGFRAVDICNRTGLSKSLMTRYMNGEKGASPDTVELIARMLGVSPAWLAGYDAPKYTLKYENDTLTERELSLVGKYTVLDDTEKELVDGFIAMLYEKHLSREKKGAEAL